MTADSAAATEAADGPDPWSAAVLAAALVAIDPRGLPGLHVRAEAGPVRDRFLGLLGSFLPEGAPVRRVPAHIADDRLLGGLDLAATLSAGRPVMARGLLAEADGGLVVLPMAERLPRPTAARIAGILADGGLGLARDGAGGRVDARFAVVALDEGGEDEAPPPSLVEHLAIPLDLRGLRIAAAIASPIPVEDVRAAREKLAAVALPPALLIALAEASVAFGVPSIRSLQHAAAAARALAALDGRTTVAEADVTAAVRLVLLPRATRLPMAEPPPEEAPPEAEPPPEDPSAEAGPDDGDQSPLGDRVIDAVRAALPPDLLARLAAGLGPAPRLRSEGRAGLPAASARRGRPIGMRPGDPRAGGRLDLVATLRAAAPWQAIRRAAGAAPGRIAVRRDDFRIRRFAHETQTTTIFVVDASGSAAMHRLAEAKGAVELILSECYVRRDKVALIAFRGRAADLMLPPTHSLTRVKKRLAALPGGGGTPLAAAIDEAGLLALAVRRKGETPLVVFLTDGQANIARDGKGGRPAAEADAVAAGTLLRANGIAALFVDTSRRPDGRARRVADAMGARYLPLPQADAQALSAIVRRHGV
jgi:magnesium chelatase subunit D